MGAYLEVFFNQKNYDVDKKSKKFKSLQKHDKTRFDYEIPFNQKNLLQEIKNKNSKQ